MKLTDIEKTAKELGYPCVIPMVKTLKNIGELKPTDVYRELAKKHKYSYLLESAEIGEKIARYSYIGAQDNGLIVVENGRITSENGVIDSNQPLKELSKMTQRFKVNPGRLPKFFGGLLGYFSYDMVRYFEDIGNAVPDELGQKDASFIMVKNLIAFDHWREEILLISNLMLEGPEEIENEYNTAFESIQNLEGIVERTDNKGALDETTPVKLEVKSNFTKEEFEMAVKLAKEHIMNGDIFQVVLSQRFETEFDKDPFSVYQALKEINPSPYMYLLDFDEYKIIGSSPEILVKVDDRKVTLRPIAGTRPRGRDVVEDEALAREMVNDEKERAEHLMLVDLGRNDVGKVAIFGSVEVTEFYGVEKYSHVQHIISNVEGGLREGLTSYDALEASFPAGTVTGAPKVRAMEIIEELEPSRRGIYAGSVGAFCFDGDMDFAITIRTIVLQGGKAYVQSGAGIVADSDPEKEFEETLNKGRGMVKALELAGGQK